VSHGIERAPCKYPGDFYRALFSRFDGDFNIWV
jgi:hypothetical protein